jgi:hypothetical protein
MLYKGGQNIDISWLTNGVKSFNLEYSTNYGKSWETIVSKHTGGSSDGYHYSYSWSVPSAVDGKNVIVRVMDGDNPDVWSIRNSFAKDIRFGSNGVENGAMRHCVQPAHVRIAIEKSGSEIVLKSNVSIHGTVELYTSNGKRISSMQLSGSTASLISTKGLGTATYVVRMKADNGKQFIKHFLHNR